MLEARDAKRVRSEPSYLVVDSGTTTTRVRLVRGRAVVRSQTREVGARDTAIDRNSRRLRDALREMLSEFVAEEPDLESALLSGMITSNVGLLEVPHLTAPASLDDLARGIVRHDFPDLAQVPFHFVRGIRTLGNDDDLDGFDVLRGEEAEVTGLRELLDLGREAVFVHLGSHHKAIDVAADGSILASRTALTGELLAAVREHTILSGSLAPLEDLDVAEEAWREGIRAAHEHGVGRALFLVRVGEQIGGRTRAQMTSYLLGVLASLDLPLLQLRDGDERVVVLYGRGPFKAILYRHLVGAGEVDVRAVDEGTSETAAAIGAVSLYERRKRLKETS